MPELPEVNFARNLLKRNCLGKVIRDIVAMDDEIVFEGVKAADFAKSLKGRTILEANRHVHGQTTSVPTGKYLWLRMDSPPHPIFHFGMTGSFHVRGKEQMVYRRDRDAEKAEEWPPRFTKCAFTLDDGTQVAFTNARRLGRVRLANDPCKEKPLSELGPDAHEALPDVGSFAEMLVKRSAPIKALLLDQSFLAGVGNWIADEVLYQSKIHPGQPANTLLPAEIGDLHKSMLEVIDHAVKVDADYKHFPEHWLFHYRWGKGKGGSTAHGGKKIDFVTVGGRTSAVVVGVQKLYKRNGAKAIAGKSPAKSKNIVPKAESLVPLSQPPSVAGKGRKRAKREGEVKIEAEPLVPDEKETLGSKSNERKRAKAEVPVTAAKEPKRKTSGTTAGRRRAAETLTSASKSATKPKAVEARQPKSLAVKGESITKESKGPGSLATRRSARRA